MANYDILGNIAIVKFPREMKVQEKKQFAAGLLRTHQSVRTVLEKSDRFKGRLRTLKTKWIAGDKTKEVLYKENGCVFRFNVESCYFSPRLASERKEVAGMVRKGEQVLVLFGGVGPFAIVIAKRGKAARVVSVELGKECNRYAAENVKRNKVSVELVQGDVRKVLPRMREQFDRIVMARPNLKDSFLDVSFKKVKKGGTVHYYGFYAEEDVGKLRELLEGEARKAKRKIKIVRVVKAGDIGVRRFLWRADLQVLN